MSNEAEKIEVPPWLSALASCRLEVLAPLRRGRVSGPHVVPRRAQLAKQASETINVWLTETVASGSRGSTG